MKKLVVVVLSIILLVACTSNNEVITDNLKFKEEYESLNSESIESTLGYVQVSINEDNPMKYISEADAVELLTSGTGIIYFGFNTCPWCRNIVPVLIDAAMEKNINTVYYLNVLNIRDRASLNDNGTINYEYEGTSGYRQIVSILKDYLEPYEGLNDDDIKRLYVPDVFFIKDGKIVGHHADTVESHTNGNDLLNEEQKEELKNIYTTLIDETYKTVECNESC